MISSKVDTVILESFNKGGLLPNILVRQNILKVISLNHDKFLTYLLSQNPRQKLVNISQLLKPKNLYTGIKSCAKNMIPSSIFLHELLYTLIRHKISSDVSESFEFSKTNMDPLPDIKRV